MKTYRFANDLCVNRERLLELQIDRYSAEGASNLHEPVEESWFAYVLARTGDSGVFLDVGAAIGYYTALVRRGKPGWTIYAMEPQADMREGIAETLALNGLEAGALVLDPRALSDGAGKEPFLQVHYGSGIATQPRQIARSDSVVDTVALSTVIADLGRPATLAKIDIQGHEEVALRAARAALSDGAIEWLILGTHSKALHEACLDILGACFEIVHQDQAPPEQPDGIIVARYAGNGRGLG